MSIWTHVVGCIRIDGLPEIDSKIKDVETIFGRPCLFNNLMGGADRNLCKLPMGSEGSLEYKIYEYSNGMPWLAIPIWGDLRDVDSCESIRKWWFDILKEIDSSKYCFYIRDAILKIDVEGSQPIILS
jgi:hypothetical protein